MTELFKPRNEHPYNLRHILLFNTPSVGIVDHRTESILFLGPKIWNVLTNEPKNIDSLNAFMNRIENWKPDKCCCRICKVCISSVGFI